MAKKVDSKILSFMQAIEDPALTYITYDAAWEDIADYADLEGTLDTSDTRTDRHTNFIIYINNSTTDHSKEITIPLDHEKAFDRIHGDWDWDYVYKTVVNYIIDNKIVKKPRERKISVSNKVKKGDPIKCKGNNKPAVKSKINK